ncbi:MAG: SixA phosphatase family protein [Flavisolibacter sp.]
MKTLLLIRHAKSSWDVPGQNDFDRPLNDRGKEDAPQMAKRLKDKKIKPDLFISSPAKRAFRTARYFAEEYDIKKEDIKVDDDLYLATTAAFSKVIENLNNKYDTVVLFSHNPGITQLANSLTGVRIDNMPTCGIFAVKADTRDWLDFDTVEKKFMFFDYPKNPLE